MPLLSRFFALFTREGIIRWLAINFAFVAYIIFDENVKSEKAKLLREVQEWYNMSQRGYSETGPMINASGISGTFGFETLSDETNYRNRPKVSIAHEDITANFKPNYIPALKGFGRRTNNYSTEASDDLAKHVAFEIHNQLINEKFYNILGSPEVFMTNVTVKSWDFFKMYEQEIIYLLFIQVLVGALAVLMILYERIRMHN